MGIEPTSEAWEASILPLYDARSLLTQTCLHTHCVCYYFPFLAALHRGKRGEQLIEPIRTNSSQIRQESPKRGILSTTRPISTYSNSPIAANTLPVWDCRGMCGIMRL